MALPFSYNGKQGLTNVTSHCLAKAEVTASGSETRGFWRVLCACCGQFKIQHSQFKIVVHSFLIACLCGLHADRLFTFHCSLVTALPSFHGRKADRSSPSAFPWSQDAVCRHGGENRQLLWCEASAIPPMGLSYDVNTSSFLHTKRRHFSRRISLTPQIHIC